MATYASAGAQFGYSTLFFMVVVTVGYVCVQEMVARLAAHTGKGLAALIREQFSLRLSAFAVLAFAVANLGLVVTEFAGIATRLRAVGGVALLCRCPSPPWPSGCWSSSGSYRYAERVFLLLTLAFITYPIAMFLGHPDWKQVAVHTVLPHFIGSKAFLLVAVALIGTTITPYIQLYTAGRGGRPGHRPRGVQVRAGRRRAAGRSSPTWSRCASSSPPPRSSAAPAALSSAAEAAKALEPLAGQFGRTLFGIGLLGRLGPGRRRGPAVDLLRGGRGGGGRAVGVEELP